MKQIVLLLPVSFTYDGDAQLATTTITTQPANQIKHMENASFTVLATNATSYQWQAIRVQGFANVAGFLLKM
jgi:hypothetical protein